MKQEMSETSEQLYAREREKHLKRMPLFTLTLVIHWIVAILLIAFQFNLTLKLFVATVYLSSAATIVILTFKSFVAWSKVQEKRIEEELKDD